MRNVQSLAVSLLGAALLAAPTSFAADAMGGIYMNPSEVKWGDAPPVFAKGAKMAVLSGDPGKAAPFVARLMLPANYKVAPHWQINGMGPFDITYINPSDDPSKAPAKK